MTAKTAQSTAAVPASLKLYAVVARVAALCAPAWLRRRARRGKEDPLRWPERTGRASRRRPAGPLAWLHGVSVGESLSLLPVIERMRALRPDLAILVTTATPASAKLLAERLDAAAIHQYAPLDAPDAVARFLDHWRPALAVFVESELWPNMILACRARRVRLALVSARLSERSAAGWRRWPRAARAVVGAFDLVLARDGASAAAFAGLGVRDVGEADLKFGAPPLPADATALDLAREAIGGRPVALAASTHPGEEPLIRAVHGALAPSFPGLLTIVAPRHPERGEALAGVLGAPRRGLGQGPPEEGLWLVDTLGEMGLWYRLAQVAFVGRSLVAPGGGQNPLEPARLGRAIVLGPLTGNFSEQVALLRDAGGLEVVADVPALTRFVAAMLSDPAAREAMGERARAAHGAPESLVEDTAEAVLGLMGGG